MTTQPIPRQYPEDPATHLQHAIRCAEATQRGITKFVQASPEPSDQMMEAWDLAKQCADILRQLEVSSSSAAFAGVH